MFNIKLLMIKLFVIVIIVSLNAYAVQEELIKYSWIQLGDNNKKFLRVVSTANTCPLINVDAVEKKMEFYVGKDRSFNVISCIYEIKANDKNIKFAGKNFDVSSKKIEKILVIGDTGCRVVPGYVQDCKKDWHYKKIMDTALKHKPDLIIHLGDYFYREKCMLNNKCRYENTGDNFRTWEDEFFKPAYSALWSFTPWIFLRGNHEDCRRGGLGWVHFFDFGRVCKSKNDNYTVDIEDNNVKMVVMDSSNKKNNIENINYNVKNLWILTHIPFEKNEIMKLPKNLQLVLSGHEHKVRFYQSDNKALHAVIGHGGTLLDNNIKDGAIYEYGFAIINKISDGWLFTVYNYDDTILSEHKVKN